MVNYCCVNGCGRNSRQNKHLNYYSLPKERHRQVDWLRLAGRIDLLEKDQCRLTVSHRFCSRHFSPSSIKNRNLCLDAVPTLYLPGDMSEAESDDDSLPHSGVICDNCQDLIERGFRYKCVICPDYDLCQKCEMLEVHREHYMIRIPKPMKYQLADNLIQKWREFFNAEHITPDDDAIFIASESSDDEPITKYANNYDSGVDLSEDIKNKIRREVKRVLTLKPEKKTKVNKKDRKRSGEEIDMSDKSSKKMRTEKENSLASQRVAILDNKVPEMVFADVNEIKDGQVDLKSVFPSTSTPLPAPTPIPASTSIGPKNQQQPQPVMHVKLSDDLSELMIEVNNQKTIYKYT